MQDADQLTIETPEQVDLQMQLSGVGSRLLAVFTDSLLQFTVTLILFLLAALLLTAIPSLGRGAHALDWSGAVKKWALAGIILVQFVLLWGYFTLFEAFWNGQTPGKRLLKIRVLADSGRPITLFESMARNLLRIIDFLPSLYLAGIVTMLLNRQGKRLGDLLAGTLVVHAGSLLPEPLRINTSRTLLPDASVSSAFSSAVSAQPSSGSYAVPHDAIARLGSADAHVLETFFARNLDLSLEVRHRMALRIAEQLTAKMAWAPAGFEEHPERLLEALLFPLRDRRL